MASPTPQPYGGTGYSTSKYNTLAIVGFVLAFVINIAGLVVSIVALSQIKRTGERGRGLALAGIIIGAVSIVLSIVIVIVFVGLAAQLSTTTTY
ncbi:hypothetical protein AS850_00390 [Frondihabitans sp. 762G35]|uniref:DUF4190 domain-containing protein n=1 Tax=Frondihabitans sp. 762G35 TaxID=1446794 RepID=UPI000D20F040|nr:DUF4190 domain-containing protein [Frondihabitans sp. 762G35]ARC55533.1 hypothetical protein AS850_00390 [Frondihabitans sp. 762G35]